MEQAHSLIPSTRTINQKEAQNPKNDQFQTNRIKLPWPTYIESRTKRGRLETRAKETY